MAAILRTILHECSVYHFATKIIVFLVQNPIYFTSLTTELINIPFLHVLPKPQGKHMLEMFFKFQLTQSAYFVLPTPLKGRSMCELWPYPKFAVKISHFTSSFLFINTVRYYKSQTIYPWRLSKQMKYCVSLNYKLAGCPSLLTAKVHSITAPAMSSIYFKKVFKSTQLWNDYIDHTNYIFYSFYWSPAIIGY